MSSITIGIGYKKEFVFFHLKLISIAAERAFQAEIDAFADLKTEERSKKELETVVNAIGRWSETSPTKKQSNVKTGEQEEVSIFADEAENAFAAVTKFFSELDPVQAERIANRVIYEYRLAMQPEVVFP